MDIRGRNVLILGGSGLVGMAVARKLLPHRPRSLVLSALTADEVDDAISELRRTGVPDGVRLSAESGDLFLPVDLEDRPRREVLEDPEARARLLDHLLSELTDDVVEQSNLGALLLRVRPDLVVDCVNTATAFAYQNVFDSAAQLREMARDGGASSDAVEHHLATLHLPQLIRHVQIALEGMRRAETSFYLKIGTAGTGGMGLNIPFTHSEERPSRMLLAKAGVAGAHTMYLYLMARTPGGPAVKEIKPTAAISWKRIAFGEVRRGGRPIERYDATEAVDIGTAFASDHPVTYAEAGGPLQGVYMDAGENGLFSRGEFEVLTSLGLMEYITPQEIAENAVREIQGHATGRDVVGALDAATSGPTYRAGVLREAAISRMAELERRESSEAVAYEMLGPPRLSKLLFEAAILRRLFESLRGATELDPETTAAASYELLKEDQDLRVRMLSIGLPILLPEGRRVLRGPEVRVAPDAGEEGTPEVRRLAERGWVDLRAGNWRKWRERARAMLEQVEAGPGAGDGSGSDGIVRDGDAPLQPGELVAWVFRYEDRGERIKR